MHFHLIRRKTKEKDLTFGKINIANIINRVGKAIKKTQSLDYWRKIFNFVETNPKYDMS